MSLDFVTIDVETANEDISSICQIGAVKYINGEIVDEWSILIDPEDDFSFYTVNIHGITFDDVKNCVVFSDIYEDLKRHLEGNLVIHHTHFDRASINKAINKNKLEPIECDWLDSSMVARRTWSDVAYKGYGLANLADKIGYKFKHHDALEDAKACGAVFLEALKLKEVDIEECKKLVKKSITSHKISDAEIEINTDGILYGNIIAFTGQTSRPRKENALLAAQLGCEPKDSVTKKTTMLVVGDQDLTKLNGKDKSSKHLKAEELIKKGHDIKILSESDFVKLTEV